MGGGLHVEAAWRTGYSAAGGRRAAGGREGARCRPSAASGASRALGGAALRIAAGELLVDGEGRLAVRRIELGPAPQPQVGVAGAEQRQRRVVGGRELIRRLPELVDGEDVVARLEIALGEVVVDL